MNQTRFLEKNEVPAILRRAFPEYRGAKFEARIVTGKFQPNAMHWSGGTRSEYVALNLVTGEQRAIVDRRPFPHNQGPAPAFDIEPGWCIVEHCVFCGKDLGIRFHVRPENVATLLPAPADTLPREDLIVLAITKTLISRARADEARRHGISPAQWEESKSRLIASGHLKKNGAITPKGRNAAQDCPVRVY